MRLIQVELPAGLRSLASASTLVHVPVEGEVTPHAVVNALESRFPALAGTIREHGTGRRRAYLRFLRAAKTSRT